ncbi:MAG: hypothetical protein IPL56_09115 [Saprospiraceae bacterium]|nr:hypothetical protein [Saprospiraceae bacterium]
MLRYSTSGQQAMVDIRSLDNKERWISAIDLKSGTPPITQITNTMRLGSEDLGLEAGLVEQSRLDSRR